MKTSPLWPGLVALAFFAGHAFPDAVAAQSKPNILVLVADDLGYGELGCQGYTAQIPTPNIDRLAREGVRFTSGYVTGPYCSPTRAGLMTGRYQQRFGHEFNPGPPEVTADTVGLSLQEKTIGDRFQEIGYTTGWFGKSHLGYAPQFHPLQRGFDDYFGFLGGMHSYLDAEADPHNPILRGSTPVKAMDYTTDAFGRAAVDFIQQHNARPWFCYLAFNAVHMPLEAPAKYLARFTTIADKKRRTYAAMQSAMDDAIGTVLGKIRELGQEANTLIFFFSDNGGPTAVTTASNGPLHGFKSQTWEGGIRIPFLIQWKGHLPAGKVDDRPVIQLDILPTALAAAGVTAKPEWRLDGVNLLPYLTGEKTGAPHDVLYWRFGQQIALRRGDWKLVKAPVNEAEARVRGGKGSTAGAQLYNLKQDLGETENLAGKNPGKLQELSAIWEKMNNEMVAPTWGHNSSAPEKFPSPVPKQSFSTTLGEQEQELKINALMRRFAVSRQKLAADRYRPAYHFVSPESTLNDPNGLCLWQGRWHLFYQAYPPEDRRQHWGHTVSDDLVHWRDLPYAIYPGLERMCFSGSTVVEEKQVVAFYPGIDAGMMVAVSRDPLLLNWEKIPGNPVAQPARDSCIWKQGDTYLGLLGSDRLLASTNLVDWKVANASFLSGPAFPIDDGNCPNFVSIGDKHILLLFSHTRGGQYLLGDYNPREFKFTPYDHGRFNHGLVAPAGVHAPSAASDGQGGVIHILNLNEGKSVNGWDHLFSLAQHLTLGPDQRLRIEPVAAVAALRGPRQHIEQTALPANQEIVLDAIQGDTLELEVEIDPKTAAWVQLNVLRSPNAEEYTALTFYNYDRNVNPWFRRKSVISLDSSRSSTLPDVLARPPETAEIERGSDPLRLRVFLDRSVVEVFVNGKLYLALRVYPGRTDSLGVSVRAQGQDAVLKRLDAWQMRAIWPKSE